MLAETAKDSAETSATAAAGSATTAESESTDAAASAAAAAVSETEAATARSNAETSATQASASETAADGSAHASAISAIDARAAARDAEASAGLDIDVRAEVDEELDERLSAVLGLRAKAGDAAGNLEIVALQDASGPASLVRMRADALLFGENFRADALGRLFVDEVYANNIRNVRPLWAGNRLLSTSRQVIVVKLNESIETMNVLEFIGAHVVQERSQGTVNHWFRVAVDVAYLPVYPAVTPGPGTSSSSTAIVFNRGGDAREWSLWRSADYETLYVRRNDPSDSTHRLTAVIGLRNPDLTVQPPALENRVPVASAGPSQTVTAGDTVTLDGRGSFDPDGAIAAYRWRRVAGTAVRLSNSAIARPTFTAPASAETMRFRLTVQDDDGATSFSEVTINVVDAPNDPPVADAGPAQTVQTGTEVTLDGSGSADADGRISAYLWEQVGGPDIVLGGAATASPSFTPTVAGAHVFSLTVTDDDGATNLDTVTITVTAAAPPNDPPVADAGPAQTVQTGAEVTLDGSGSADADGTIAMYRWRQISGTQVVLSNVAGASPTFTAPSQNDSLGFALTVTDDDGASDTATVVITVAAAGETVEPPVADAGKGQTVRSGARVRLDGTASSGGGGYLASFAWRGIGGLAVPLERADTATPSFVAPDVTGRVDFVLTVTDEAGLTSVDSVSVQVNAAADNAPPVADAGDRQTVFFGEEVQLDGSGSHDPDGAIAFYRWEQVVGADVELSDPAAARPTFIAPNAIDGLAFRLTVTDTDGATADASVVVVVRPEPVTPNRPPAADAGLAQSVLTGTEVTLDGSASVDTDGTIGGYRWRKLSGPAVNLSGAATSMATFTPTAAGTYVFLLTVTDDDGLAATSTTVITVSAAPVAPNAPTRLAVAQVRLESGLRASWTASTTGTAPVLYTVERADASGGPWGVLSEGQEATHFVDVDLDPDTTYYYRVRAENEAGESSYATANAKTATAAQVDAAQTPQLSPEIAIPPPSSVTRNDAHPSPPIAVGIASDTNKLTVYWQPPAQSAGSVTYRIDRSPDGVTGWVTLNAALAATRFEDLSVTTGSTWTYRVRAQDNNGNSAWVQTVGKSLSSDRPSGPEAPTGEAVDENTMRLFWQPPEYGKEPEGYRVRFSRNYRRGPWKVFNPATLLNHLTVDVSGLLPRTSYSFQVRAENSAGKSPWSPSAWLQTSPARPEVSITGGTYRIRRRTGGNHNNRLRLYIDFSSWGTVKVTAPEEGTEEVLGAFGVVYPDRDWLRPDFRWAATRDDVDGEPINLATRFFYLKTTLHVDAASTVPAASQRTWTQTRGSAGIDFQAIARAQSDGVTKYTRITTSFRRSPDLDFPGRIALELFGTGGYGVFVGYVDVEIVETRSNLAASGWIQGSLDVSDTVPDTAYVSLATGRFNFHLERRR